MPKPTIRIPTISQFLESVLLDEDGNEAVRIGPSEVTVTEPDGSETTRKVSEYLRTVDGLSWNPGLMLGAAAILVVICSFCRRPRRGEKATHGICTVQNAVACVKCAAVCCPRHRVFCSDDQARCPRCALKWRRRNLLRRIFFRPSEED